MCFIHRHRYVIKSIHKLRKRFWIKSVKTLSSLELSRNGSNVWKLLCLSLAIKLRKYSAQLSMNNFVSFLLIYSMIITKISSRFKWKLIRRKSKKFDKEWETPLQDTLLSVTSNGKMWYNRLFLIKTKVKILHFWKILNKKWLKSS